MPQDKLVHTIANPAFELYDAWHGMLRTLNVRDILSGTGQDKVELNDLVEKPTSGWRNHFRNYSKGIQITGSRGINIAGFTEEGPVLSFGYARYGGSQRWTEMLLAPKGKFWVRSWGNWGSLNALSEWAFLGTTSVYRRRVMFVPPNISEVNERASLRLDFRDWETQRPYFYPEDAPDWAWWELVQHEGGWVAVPDLTLNYPKFTVRELRNYRALNEEGGLYGESIRRYSRIRRKQLLAEGKDPDTVLDEATIAKISQVVDVYEPANKHSIETRPKEARI